MKRIFLILLPLLCLLGCAAPAAAPSSAPTQVEVEAPTQAPQFREPTAEDTQSTVDIAPEAAALQDAPAPAVPVILACEAPGLLEERSDRAVIDYSNSADGYVMAQFLGSTGTRLKLRITGPTTTYTYNLPPEEWTVFPLSDGSGSYQITIYENISDDRYAAVLSATLEAALTDEFAPFLRPNQYVNYTDAPNTMELGSQLCTGLTHPLEKVAAVYDYVVGAFTYDHEKAQTVKSGYLPVLDAVLESKTGICFDYAAVMTAMLRSQQVPCKLVVGYAGSAYHAWISVWSEEDGWIDGAIYFDGHVWKRMDPTFASSGQRSESIMDFIEHGEYVTKYLY